MRRIYSFVLALLLMASTAEARYIDYPGGWTVMQMNDGENNTLMAYYTLAPRYSLGYEIDYWREEEWLMNSLQGAYLLRRWNETDGQANLYIRGGVGVATSDFEEFDDKTEAAGFGGMAFDAENRRFLVSYENKYTHAGDIFGAFEQKARVGVAPYIAEYGALHTWIILQMDHRPESEDQVVWTPMLRFFKGDTLVEVGISDSEELLLNVMIRF